MEVFVVLKNDFNGYSEGCYTSVISVYAEEQEAKDQVKRLLAKKREGLDYLIKKSFLHLSKGE